MRRNLRVKDVGELLEEARSPVWFRWRDEAFETTPPFRGIEIRGSVTLTEENVGSARLAIATRYLGTEAARAYVDAVAEEAVLVRLEPRSVRAWDFSDVWPAP